MYAPSFYQSLTDTPLTSETKTDNQPYDDTKLDQNGDGYEEFTLGSVDIKFT